MRQCAKSNLTSYLQQCTAVYYGTKAISHANLALLLLIVLLIKFAIERPSAISMVLGVKLLTTRYVGCLVPLGDK